MEKWYEIVRNIEDDSVDEVGDSYRYKTKLLVTQIFQELKTAKIKEKVKFKQRMGPEFEQWDLHLKSEYPEDLVIDILNNDEFWEETLKLTQGI
jgi:hypothetical protein